METFRKYGRALSAAAVVGASTVAMNAQAALDSVAVAGIVDTMETDAQTAFDAVLPAVGLVLGLTIGLKLLKRFSNKI